MLTLPMKHSKMYKCKHKQLIDTNVGMPYRQITRNIICHLAIKVWNFQRNCQCVCLVNSAYSLVVVQLYMYTNWCHPTESTNYINRIIIVLFIWCFSHQRRFQFYLFFAVHLVCIFARLINSIYVHFSLYWAMFSSDSCTEILSRPGMWMWNAQKRKIKLIHNEICFELINIFRIFPTSAIHTFIAT